MILFQSDYLEGAHPRVMQRLLDTNFEQCPGYSEDHYCDEARVLIQKLCDAPEAAVHFLVGGTQANRTVIASALRAHQGVLSADTGHIACHETGAIENAGHKVLALPHTNGKISAAQVADYCAAHYADASFEHLVQPGMVYISNPTEFGTVYTRQELTELYAACQKCGIPLFIDGARLGAALHSTDCDYTLAEIAHWCDVFYIGGTKMGALFGEAVVIMNPAMQKDFRYFIKQNGGMFAKGRLLGLQFLALLEDGLYDEIGRHEVKQALRIRDGITAKGYSFLMESPTNQQFPILPDAVLEELKKNFAYTYWQSMGNGESAVRFCTSWATTEENVTALLDAIPAKA